MCSITSADQVNPYTITRRVKNGTHFAPYLCIALHLFTRSFLSTETALPTSLIDYASCAKELTIPISCWPLPRQPQTTSTSGYASSCILTGMAVSECGIWVNFTPLHSWSTMQWSNSSLFPRVLYWIGSPKYRFAEWLVTVLYSYKPLNQ